MLNVRSIIFDLSALPMSTRLAILDDHAHQLETKGHSYWSQEPEERKGFKLFGVGNDAKTKKGEKLGVDTAILYLSPASNATPKGETLCPSAVQAKCLKACLYTAGRGRMSSVEMSRLYKTLLYTQRRATFWDILNWELEALKVKAKKNGRTLAVRINGTSDIILPNWLLKEHADVQFYDYSKNVEYYNDKSLVRRRNHHVTLSYSGANNEYRHAVLDAAMNGHNIAVVFRNREQAEKAIAHGWLGFECIDGDETDVRFLDPRATVPGQAGYVVALYAKGNAKNDRTGFVIDY
jgi:hypothetical protein